MGVQAMRKPRAIIYDDEIVIVQMLERYFSKRGYEVLSYTEPNVCPLYEKCADSCTELNPCGDIVLTDLRMPKMTGIELLQRQAQRGCKIDTRNKAIMSAQFADEDERRIAGLDCSLFEKPFQLAVISNWINECEKRFDLSRPLTTH